MTGGSQGDDGPGDGGKPGQHGQSENEGEDIAVDQLLASLRVIAKEEQIKTDGQIAPLVSPLSADERGQIAAAILAAQRPGQGVVTPLAPRRTNRRRWIAAVVPLAAAASLVFVLRGRSDSSREWPALPAYEVSARGGIKEYRHGGPESTDSAGATARPERVSRNSELVVTCRPQTAVEGPLAARAFLIQQDGAARGSRPRSRSPHRARRKFASVRSTIGWRRRTSRLDAGWFASPSDNRRRSRSWSRRTPRDLRATRRRGAGSPSRSTSSPSSALRRSARRPGIRVGVLSGR